VTVGDGGNVGGIEVLVGGGEDGVTVGISTEAVHDETTINSEIETINIICLLIANPSSY
jgi:hypothetical protein